MRGWGWAVVGLAWVGCSSPAAPSSASTGATGGATTGATGSSNGGSATTGGSSGTTGSVAAFDGSWPSCDAECAGAQSEYQAVVTNLAGLVDGGTTKFGALTIVTSFDAGARIQVVNPGTHPVLTVIVPDPSDVIASGDFNQDGVVDYQYEQSVSGTISQTLELTDSNFDGAFDEQDLANFDLSTGAYPLNLTETYATFQAPDGGGASSWVQTWSYSGPGEAYDCDLEGCSGMDGFPDPTATGVTLVPVPGTQISIVEAQPVLVPGACRPAAIPILLAAFEHALFYSATSYPAINPKLGTLLANALAAQPMLIGCGLTCPCAAADTSLPGSKYAWNRLTGVPQQMNLSEPVMAGTNAAGQSEILIHELLHFAGVNHNPPVDGSPPGHDQVYGCGRFANWCRSGATLGSTDTAVGFSWDCAACADDAHKSSCGFRTYGIQLPDVSQCTQDGEGDCGMCNSEQKMSCDRSNPQPLPKSQPQACCGDCGDCDPSCVPGWADPSAGVGWDECAVYPILWCTSGY